MNDLSYAVNPLRIGGNPALVDASREELRVLLLLVESGGEIDVDSLSSMAKISAARSRSALAFWEESGVIRRREGGEAVIMTEFDELLRPDEIDEVPAVRVAKSIRDENLADTIRECEALMGNACLSQEEVKLITALHTQYALSPEYIALLAAHLAHKGTLTARRLSNTAIRLCRNNCDSVEALEAYIAEKEASIGGVEWEFRRLLGIYGRSLSPSERAYFKKWSEEYDYSVTVVGEAFDIAVLNTKDGKADLRYMDSVLTDWHTAGCRTVAECRARCEAKRLEVKQTEPKKKSKTVAQAPRYGNFDVQDAFEKALERSYGENDRH